MKMKLMATMKARLCIAAAALGLLVSCGGGTEQIEPFAPTRLLVFGDEMSVLTKTPVLGRKYSVNALDATTAQISCALFPLWTQVLANTYLFAFEECNTAGVLVPQGKIYAKVGAKTTDFEAQVAEAQAAAGGFTTTDLVTVLLGANDVLDLYQNQYLPNPTANTANAIIAELQARGMRLGQQINALTELGPRVILSTMPLMGLTPYALREVINSGDAQRAALLNNFSNAFNTAVRVNIVNDGHYIGLVELDALVNAAVASPTQYGFVNVTQGVCSVALPNCSTATLVTTATNAATTWLWASDLWMGTTAHLTLGNFARGRALGNPF
ncbi:MAG: SGNH/GDSL hydrolase family protein [Rubrivivax sp.]